MELDEITGIVVEACAVMELKSVEKMSPVHAKQTLTYIRLMKLQVGLLINFGGETLKEGLKRIVNKTPSLNLSNHVETSESSLNMGGTKLEKLLRSFSDVYFH